MSVKDHPTSRARQPTPNATTPRPQYATRPGQVEEGPNMKTPTRDTFAGLAGQRPLPNSTLPTLSQAVLHPDARSFHPSEHPSQHNQDNDTDVKMGEGDEEGQSDNESTMSDTTRAKKKKSQRFFCTEFPPCDLSFTRSEHLARHVRKHTGERPFQCHCLRRFSRLDNLRQHAQTVHSNEDIPGDSLAATSTRFQRQIRTDRMRPPNVRARGSSHSNHSRGHSRNWSGSSIGSVSDIASPDEGRRRPQPLAMAQFSPTRGTGLILDTYSGHASGHPSYFNDSPSGYSTPTSAFSATPSSPLLASTLQSPVTMLSRGDSWGERRPARRLSVPSSQHPLQSGYTFPQIQHMNAPARGAAGPDHSNNGSTLASPTSSVFSDIRSDSVIGEGDIRRRTWHPGTYGVYGTRPPTSGLSYYQTPDAPQPVAALQPAAAQNIRLPGIETFDNARAQPVAPIRRHPSAAEKAVSPTQEWPSIMTARTGSGHRKQDSLSSISNGMTRLDFTQPAQVNNHGNQDTFKQPLLPPPAPATFAVSMPPPATRHSGHTSTTTNVTEPQVDVTDDRRKKRHAWYNGPVAPVAEPAPSYIVTGTSPEGSNTSNEELPTPAGQPEYHPAIMHNNSYTGGPPSGIVYEADGWKSQYPRTDFVMPLYPASRTPVPVQPQIRNGGAMDRLDALVAVATSEQTSQRT